MCFQELFIKPILTGLFGAMGVYLIKVIYDSYILNRDKKRILDWLKKNTKKGVKGQEWRSSVIIASHTDLLPDRVRYICSIHNDIRPNRKRLNDMWGLKSMHGD